MRDKLIKLLRDTLNCEEEIGCINCEYNRETDCKFKRKADYLLEHGVIVPPCKVGDAVWYIEKNGGIACSLIEKIRMEQKAGWNTETVFNLIFIAGFGVPIFFEQIGEIIFLSREEAEQALKERTDK